MSYMSGDFEMDRKLNNMRYAERLAGIEQARLVRQLKRDPTKIRKQVLVLGFLVLSLLASSLWLHSQAYQINGATEANSHVILMNLE